MNRAEHTQRNNILLESDADRAGVVSMRSEAFSSSYRSALACKMGTAACDFQGEHGDIGCGFEEDERALLAKWIHPEAKVLEVGARYGLVTCPLVQLARHVVAVEADPVVWDLLEGNLKTHRCEPDRIVKGVLGQKDLWSVSVGFASFSATDEAEVDKRMTDWNLEAEKKHRSPATKYESLGVAFDTLVIDCEGCLPGFLEENAKIMDSLKMIQVECHNDAELKAVKHLLDNGWVTVDGQGLDGNQGTYGTRVVCKGSCEEQRTPCAVEAP